MPVYDCFQDDVDEEVELLVMPVLRPFDDPPFETVGEMLDFVQQTLEVQCVSLALGLCTDPSTFQGLAYMHKEGVVHLSAP